MNDLKPNPKLDQVRELQLALWQKGERVLLEVFMPTESTLAADGEALLDLIYGELLLREEFGERPGLDEYLVRFPRHGDAIRRQFDFHEALAALGDTNHGDTLDSTRTAPALLATRPAVIGNYEILDELGNGGMGVVYKARHHLLGGRLVAVKVLRHAVATPEEINRLHAEANAVAQLNHAHIVPVYEVGVYRPSDAGGEVPFIALEYVSGGTLAEKLRGTPLAPRQAAETIVPLARAMAHAHRLGIIHRDLKPANVLLTEAGQPKITDFGLAKKFDIDQGQTPSGTILGTPSYMAPEQAGGKTVGPAADIYSLGAILYELLTGRPPFQADTLLNTLRLAASTEPVAPRQLQPSVPRDLETICLKCLNKNAEKRYASADALAEDLGRFLNGEPIQARPVSTLERVGRWIKRKPALAGLIAVSFVGLCAMVVGWAYFTFQLQDAKAKAETDRDDAKRQAARAGQILRHTLVSVDTIAMAARAAKAEEIASNNPGFILFKLATSYARTSKALAVDDALPFADRKELAEQYAVSSVRLLDCAFQQGFFDPITKKENREAFRSDGDLDLLRGREDFIRLADRMNEPRPNSKGK